MIRYLFFLSLVFTHFQGFSQTPQDSVRSTINKMFAAMHDADSTALNTCFHASAILQTIASKSSGEKIIRTENLSDFAGLVQQAEKGDLKEIIEFEYLQMDGDLATVWTPYQFYYKNTFSHCGVNSFQLVRLQDEWKIIYLIDTRRKLGCETVTE